MGQELVHPLRFTTSCLTTDTDTGARFRELNKRLPVWFTRLSGIHVLTIEWNKNENKVSSYILLIRSKKIMISIDTNMTLYKTTVMAMTKTAMTKNETCSMEKYT